MAEPARLPRARALSSLVVVAGVLLVALGLWLMWDGARPGAGSSARPAPATAPTAADRAPAAVTSQVTAARRPIRPRVVVVPALGVRAAVSPIEVEDATLTPPADPGRVGWWTDGSRPGDDTGAAVLTGHTVHTGGGALDDLEELAAGDRVVVRSDARQVVYEVASVRVLSRAQLARRNARILGPSGPGRLVLITCEDWDGTAYRSNVVVTARPVAG